MHRGLLTPPLTPEHPAQSNPMTRPRPSVLIKDKNRVVVYFTIFCVIYGFFVVVTWLPEYLAEARGVEGSAVGVVSSLVPWAAIPGSIIFSIIADKMGKRRPVLLIMLPLSIISVISIVAFHNMA